MRSPLLAVAVSFGLASSGCFTPPPLGPQYDDRVATAEKLEGCQYIGGLNRAGVRGETRGLCATLVLVEDLGEGTRPEGLTLPPGWSVEVQSVVAGSCAGRSWHHPHEPGRVPAGGVVWNGSFAEPMEVDVRFPTGGDPGLLRLYGPADPGGGSCL